MAKQATSSNSRRIAPRLALVLLCLGLVFLAWCDARVRQAFDGKSWQQPAKVYARPLILAPGVALQRDELIQELLSLGYRNDPGLSEPGSFYRRGASLAVFLRAFDFADGRRPARRLNVRFEGRFITAVTNGSGQLLPEAVLEPPVIGGIYPEREEDRLLVRLEDTPRLLVETLLLVEDRAFYDHLGISPRAIFRALMANIRAGRTVQGGSTITQQLVKNVVLSRERSLWRKVQEAFMALLVEWRYSKDEILEFYINEVYLGQEGSRAIHGFALASYHYFNAPLAELDIAQVAMLVGLVKGPSLYDPWRRTELARKRRNTVLSLLAGQGWLNPEGLQLLQQQELDLAKSSALEGVYPAYLDLVRRQLRRDYDSEDLQTLGLRIFSPFDPRLQRLAERAVAGEMRQLSAVNDGLEAAVVVLDTRNANVVALVGGRSPRFAGFNRALDALRPIGSLAKPAVYLTALAQPDRWTLATRISDDALSWADPHTGTVWEPRNYDRESHGEVLLVDALSKSYNQATARLGLDLGVNAVLETFRRLGVRRSLPAVPAVFLGSASLSPLEVAGAYQTIAADGQRMALRGIYAVGTADGKLLAAYPQRPRQTLDAGVVHLMKYALQQTVREGTGRGVYRALPERLRVAGKTGTTNDLRDSWFAGFSGDYLAVVWVGRDDNAPAGLTGSSGALKIWRNFMAAASRESMPFVKPESVGYFWVDPEAGLQTREGCGDARYMPFVVGSQPRRGGDCGVGLVDPRAWFRGLFD